MDRWRRAPKEKVVKLSYTIGDHDLAAKTNAMSKWLERPRQTVKVVVALKGRAKMFEKQAFEILESVRKTCATYGKATGDIRKDGRGDPFLVFTRGGDAALIKELAAEAAAAGIELEDDEDEEEEEEEGDEDPEITDVKNELEALVAELKDGGLSVKDINEDPEVEDLREKLRQLQAAAS